MLQHMNPSDLLGMDVIGPDHDSIGRTTQVLVDGTTGQPTFVAVRTGLFGLRETLMPLAQAELVDGAVAVPYDKQTIKDAPNVGPDDQLSPDEERTLYDYYDLNHSDARTGAGHDTADPVTDDAMTRSEERVHVGKEQVEAGRARLRKHVVTEQVQQTVPVTREEVRVEREPITGDNVDRALDGPDISEEEHEVVLHEERPVVAKETVPVERVRLTKDEVTDHAEIDETVRKEQIEAPDSYPSEGDATRPRDRSADRR